MESESPRALESQAINSCQFSEEAGEQRGFFFFVLCYSSTHHPFLHHLQLTDYLGRVRLLTLWRIFLNDSSMQGMYIAHAVKNASQDSTPGLSTLPRNQRAYTHTQTHNLPQQDLLIQSNWTASSGDMAKMFFQELRVVILNLWRQKPGLKEH